MIGLGGHKPGRRALEYLQLLAVGRYFRHELGGAAAGSDDNHPFALQRVFVFPAGRVKRDSVERVQAADIRHFGAVELANCADDTVRHQGFAFAVGIHLYQPSIVALPECGTLYRVVQSHVLAQSVLVHNTVEVSLQFGCSGEVSRPLVIGLKNVAVQMIGGIDLAPRIGIFVPGTAHFRILFQHHKGYAVLQ